MGTPWRLSLGCFSGFYLKFFCKRFFHWALQISYILGRSTNNSLAAMLDSDQPPFLAPPSSGTNSSTPAAPVTTAPTFTLSQQDLTRAFSQALGDSLPQILAALQSHSTSSGSTTALWRETWFRAQLPLLLLPVFHCCPFHQVHPQVMSSCLPLSQFIAR